MSYVSYAIAGVIIGLGIIVLYAFSQVL
ncbi:hypothetical protein IBTHAUMO2_410006 [Nitrosopumilaceae archaeon]|nr:hypothetical protein IBTHAUMO2_410006 [Nitrosopumilaceae archaeon]